MRSDEFEAIFEKQVELCREVLVSKAREYATSDRLHNFRVAATLQQESPAQALAGMLAKHIVSIFDMVADDGYYTVDQWDEKIGDALNYLFLLKAVVLEGRGLDVNSRS